MVEAPIEHTLSWQNFVADVAFFVLDLEDLQWVA